MRTSKHKQSTKSHLQYAAAGVAIQAIYCMFLLTIVLKLPRRCSHLTKKQMFCIPMHFSPHFRPSKRHFLTFLHIFNSKCILLPLVIPPHFTVCACVCDSMCLWWNQQDVKLHWLSWCIQTQRMVYDYPYTHISTEALTCFVHQSVSLKICQ